MLETLGALSTAVFLRYRHFMCISYGNMGKTRTNSLRNVSQPKCRLLVYNNWVHHLSCRYPTAQVLLWSFNKKSARVTMALNWHLMICKQNYVLCNLKVEEKKRILSIVCGVQGCTICKKLFYPNKKKYENNCSLIIQQGNLHGASPVFVFLVQCSY